MSVPRPFLLFLSARLTRILDVNGRHLGFTFLIGRMTDVLAPDIYSSLTTIPLVVEDLIFLLLFLLQYISLA
jgi:hypothetical protein